MKKLIRTAMPYLALLIFGAIGLNLDAASSVQDSQKRNLQTGNQAVFRTVDNHDGTVSLMIVAVIVTPTPTATNTPTPTPTPTPSPTSP
jgi:hypothetical protein